MKSYSLFGRRECPFGMRNFFLSRFQSVCLYRPISFLNVIQWMTAMIHTHVSYQKRGGKQCVKKKMMTFAKKITGKGREGRESQSSIVDTLGDVQCLVSFVYS